MKQHPVRPIARLRGAAQRTGKFALLLVGLYLLLREFSGIVRELHDHVRPSNPPRS